MALPTKALQCEHGVHPRYCALCRARVLAEHGQAPITTRRRANRPGEGPMPSWFREEAARSIARVQAEAHTEQPTLDLEDS
jgi:hypothetical protein